MALDVRWMLLASLFTFTSCLSSSAGAVAKVTLQEVASKPQLFCAQLKTRGFAVVTLPSRLGGRPAALEWLEARHAAEAALVEAEFPPGLARCADVAFPRRLRRLDLAPAAGELAISGLAAELHDVAVQCLHAIAEYEELALDELVAEVPERLDQTKEPSFLRANLYDSDGGAGPCWHVDLGLLTVMPVGSWPAMMASPFHSSVGDNAFIEELLDPERDVMVFAGTALLLATAGLGYVALVHGVSAARLREGRRISLPYFLRVRRGGIIQQPPHCDGRIAGAGLYPAAVQPGADEPPMLDLLRFHRDCYGKLCTRGQVVSLEKLAGDPALGPQLRAKFYTDSEV